MWFSSLETVVSSHARGKTGRPFMAKLKEFQANYDHVEFSLQTCLQGPTPAA